VGEIVPNMMNAVPKGKGLIGRREKEERTRYRKIEPMRDHRKL
jgi:hypothetical protein